VIRQEGAAERTQAGRALQWAGERRVRVRLLGLASLVVIAAVVSVAVGLPGRVFRPPPRPIATIAVGASPAGVAVDPAAHRAYVANRGDGTSYGTVSVLDTTRNAVVATVRVGRDPIGVALDPAARRAYVTDANGGGISLLDIRRGVPDDGTVSVLDTTRNAVIAAIGLNSIPVGIALDPATRRAYVALFGTNSVQVLDTRGNTHVGTIHMDKFKELSTSAAGLALDLAAHRAYVVISDTPGSPPSSVAVIDTDAALVVAIIRVGRYPAGVAVDPAAQRAYVTNGDDGTISVLDTQRNAVVATVQVGSNPGGVAVDPTTHRVYVADSGSATVAVLDSESNAVVTTLRVGRGPDAVAVDLTTHHVYVTNRGDGTVSVFDGGAGS